jgi:hypothetical protein
MSFTFRSDRRAQRMQVLANEQARGAHQSSGALGEAFAKTVFKCKMLLLICGALHCLGNASSTY